MREQLSMDEFLNERMTSMGEPHLACALVLDTSGSMSGSAIRNLNEGIKRFKNNVMEDPIAQKRIDVALVTFNSKVQVYSDFTPISKMPTPELTAAGRTDMASAVNIALDLVNERTKMYQSLGTPCHKPWIFLITDGASTSETEEMEKAAARVREAEMKGSHGRLSFWALGVNGYDADDLFKFTDRVIELADEDFNGIFDWLSESFTFISQTGVGEEAEVDILPKNAKKVVREN